MAPLSDPSACPLTGPPEPPTCPPKHVRPPKQLHLHAPLRAACCIYLRPSTYFVLMAGTESADVQDCMAVRPSARHRPARTACSTRRYVCNVFLCAAGASLLAVGVVAAPKLDWDSNTNVLHLYCLRRCFCCLDLPACCLVVRRCCPSRCPASLLVVSSLPHVLCPAPLRCRSCWAALQPKAVLQESSLCRLARSTRRCATLMPSASFERLYLPLLLLPLLLQLSLLALTCIWTLLELLTCSRRPPAPFSAVHGHPKSGCHVLCERPRATGAGPAAGGAPLALLYPAFRTGELLAILLE